MNAVTSSDASAYRADPRTVFWSKPYLWPDSTDQFMFLGELVLAVGPNLHAGLWTGNEPATIHVEPLPDRYHIEVPAHQLRWAALLLDACSEDYRTRCFQHGISAMPTAEEWDFAVKLSQDQATEASNALTRFWEVCGRLKHDFRSGELRTAIRAFDGGTIEPISADVWNTENWFSRFHTCQLDLEQPYGPKVIPSGGYYIFVERESLQRAVRNCRPHQEGGTDTDRYLSPYLQCMIKASFEFGITESKQPKKAELEACLREFWDGAEPLSNTDVKHMATFIRAPDRKRGRGRKPG